MTGWQTDLVFVGLWCHESTVNNLSGLSVALFTRILGWSKAELEVFLVEVRKDMKNPRIHAYWPLYVSIFPYPNGYYAVVDIRWRILWML